jgi:hypothetical protein
MVLEAATAHSSGVGSSPNGAFVLAGPYPLDGFGTRFLSFLLLLLLLWLFILNNPLWPFLLLLSSGPTPPG